MNYIKTEYKKEWQFFKSEMKIWFPALLIGFIALAVAAHYGFLALFQQEQSYITEVLKYIQQAMSGVDLAGDSAPVSMVKLFFNNARAGLVAICMGVVPFLFLPFFSFFVNGAVIGMVTSVSSYIGSFGIAFFLASLLPHGIFEIPAIIYAFALGMYLCKELSKKILKKSKKPFGAVVTEILRSYVLVILPLLVIAAIIEPTLTMKIAMNFI